MRLFTFLATGLAILGLGFPAFAHHGMDGRLPSTLAEVLLSGLAHPVIGLDHLLVIVAVGLLSLGLPRGAWLAAIFVGSSLLGTGLHLARIDVPAAEVLIAGTVVVFGTLVLASRTAGRPRHSLRWLTPVFVVAGALHGYAYGETIVGAGATPLVAYLIGFCAVQLGVVLAVRWLANWLMRRGVSSARMRAVFGGVASLAGAALVVVALRG